MLAAMKRAALLPLLLLLSSCADQTIVALAPEFSIAWPQSFGYDQASLPDSVLDFGSVATGQFRDIPIVVSNPGAASLELCEVYLAVVAFDGDAVINEIRIDADPELVAGALPEAGTMAPGSSSQFSLRFIPLFGTPVDPGVHLVVKHSLNWDCAAEAGEGLYIPVVGEGLGGPAPDIYAKPQQVDFGTVILPGEALPQQVLIGNAGPGSLDISSVTLSDWTHFGLDAAAVAGASFGQGGFDFLTVTYTPQAQGVHGTNILITSNDGDEPTLAVPLFGVADPEPIEDPPGDDDDSTPPPSDDDDTTPSDPPPAGFPIAVCGSTIFANPLEVVQLSSFSFHTGGLAQTLSLQYAWTLTRPPGSATTLSGANTSSASTSPYVDLVGTYVGHLTVTDTGGATDTCDQTIEVLPPENFRVELFWSEQDDFDLHLLEANDGAGNQGTPWTDGDCYFANCASLGLDWGVAGDLYDNPYLDLDDIPGTGPENINITDPALAPYDGWYQVMVHDYSGSTEDNYGDTDGTVNIYLNGVLVQTYTFTMSGDGAEYSVAKIHWPSGQVQACNGLGGCP
jgi:hypothetical protein